MKQKLRRIFVNSLAFLLVFALALMGNASSVKAEDATELTNIKVTDFKLTKVDGKTPDDGFNSSEHAKLVIAWDASAYGNTLKSGDYFTIKLPDNFKFPTNSSARYFDLTAPDGSVMAKAVVTPNTNGGGSVKVTFNDYVNNRSNIKGTVQLEAAFYQIKTNEKNTFTITVEGETKSFEVKISDPKGLVNELVCKWADTNASTDTETIWGGRINHMKEDLQNAVIVDKLSCNNGDLTGIHFIRDSLKLYKVEFDEVGRIIEGTRKLMTSSEYSVSYSENDTVMTLNLGNVGRQQYYFTYRTSYVKGKSIKNTMTLNYSGKSKEGIANYNESSSSGNGSGDLDSKIIINKTDSEDGAKLANATFAIKNKTTGKETKITTDSDGQAISEKLTSGDYEVKEITAPNGYFLNSETKTVTVKADSKTSLDIKDTPIKIDIPVMKTWKGEAAKSVKVYLMRNGQQTDHSLTLSADNGWKGSFTGIRKTDHDGKDYVYTVKEEKLAGYNSSVCGNAEKGFEITNVRSGKTSVSGTKIWKDNDNQDGVRPAEITVNLLRNGKKIDSQKVSASQGWKYSFPNLDQFDDQGKPYAYTVTENSIEGYTTKICNTNIINSYTPKMTSATVTKYWNDDNNQDGIRPETIKVQLYANGEKYGDEVALSQASSWTYTWNSLPLKKSGQLIKYTVKEVSVPKGYTVTYNTKDQGSMMICNKHESETTQIQGKKTWDDQDDQDGIRPEKVKVNLLADGNPVKTVTVNKESKWTYHFDELPVYHSGKRIHYTVTEDHVDGYTTQINGYDITNKRTPDTTSATVTKQWIDENNQDGMRPSSINVQLYADGKKVGSSIKLDDSSKWTYTWSNLPLKKSGRVINYSVKEEKTPEGYITGYTINNLGNMIITNTHVTKTTKVEGTKVWDDHDNQDGIRPDHVVVHLLANGKEVQKTEASEKTKWKYVFDQLPEYQAGKKIVYTVTEDTVEGYSTSIEGYQITNKRTPDMTSATVTKRWNDDNDQDGIRPQAINVQLYANGQKYNEEVSLNEQNKWSYTWLNLPARQNGKEVRYTVKEETPAGYSVAYDLTNHGNMVITNTHTPATTSVTGVKNWNDHDNQDGVRPNRVVVNLLADGQTVATVDVSEKTNWKYSFPNLPVYANGHKIVYTVTENNVPGYTTKIDGTNITNTRTSDTTNATVTKQWIDQNNQDGKRPAFIKVQLYADGEKYGDEVSVEASSHWTYTWSKLPAKKKGKVISYTVKEQVPAGYSVTYDTSDQGNMIITNTHKPDVTSITGQKIWHDQNNHDGVRPSSVTVNLLADGVIKQRMTVSAKTNWKYVFNNLQAYQNGKKIVYTVTENTVTGYTTKIDGYNIINTRTPKQMSATVTKNWDDHDDQDHLRPQNVKVQLYANGKKYRQEMILNAKSKWTYTWAGLPVIKDGKKVIYTVKEVGVPQGYTASVDNGNNGNMVIVNTHMPVMRVNQKVKTGDTTNIIKYLIAGAISAVTLLLLIYYKRKKRV